MVEDYQLVNNHHNPIILLSCNPCIMVLPCCLHKIIKPIFFKRRRQTQNRYPKGIAQEQSIAQGHDSLTFYHFEQTWYHGYIVISASTAWLKRLIMPEQNRRAKAVDIWSPGLKWLSQQAKKNDCLEATGEHRAKDACTGEQTILRQAKINGTAQTPWALPWCLRTTSAIKTIWLSKINTIW